MSVNPIPVPRGRVAPIAPAAHAGDLPDDSRLKSEYGLYLMRVKHVSLREAASQLHSFSNMMFLFTLLREEKHLSEGEALAASAR